MGETHTIASPTEGLSQDLLQAVTEIFKALSDPTRAHLLWLLTAKEYSVNELSEQVPVTASAVSHHLAKLRATRLVRSRRDGNQVLYSVDDSHVAGLFTEALHHLDHVWENLPDHPDVCRWHEI